MRDINNVVKLSFTVTTVNQRVKSSLFSGCEAFVISAMLRLFDRTSENFYKFTDWLTEWSIHHHRSY